MKSRCILHIRTMQSFLDPVQRNSIIDYSMTETLWVEFIILFYVSIFYENFISSGDESLLYPISYYPISYLLISTYAQNAGEWYRGEEEKDCNKYAETHLNLK